MTIAELDVIHREIMPWRNHNFPDFTATDQLLGVIEEVGELAHSYLKGKQKIRGTIEEHDANGMDAVGDTLIYLFGYMQFHELSVEMVLSRALADKSAEDPDRAILHIANRVGRLSRWDADSRFPHDWVSLKGRVVGEVIRTLDRYCVLREWNMIFCLQSAWDEVKERDWITWPDTGMPPEGPADGDRGASGYAVDPRELREGFGGIA